MRLEGHKGMIQIVSAMKRFWTWLIDGLSEALAAAIERYHPCPVFHVMIGEQQATIQASAGLEVGELSGDGAAAVLDPPDLAARLAGAVLDVEVPPAWVLSRTLSPIAVESAPFAAAFARHQIERVTPWRQRIAIFA